MCEGNFFRFVVLFRTNRALAIKKGIIYQTSQILILVFVVAVFHSLEAVGVGIESAAEGGFVGDSVAVFVTDSSDDVSEQSSLYYPPELVVFKSQRFRGYPHKGVSNRDFSFTQKVIFPLRFKVPHSNVIHNVETDGFLDNRGFGPSNVGHGVLNRKPSLEVVQEYIWPRTHFQYYSPSHPESRAIGGIEGSLVEFILEPREESQDTGSNGYQYGGYDVYNNYLVPSPLVVFRRLLFFVFGICFMWGCGWFRFWFTRSFSARLNFRYDDLWWINWTGAGVFLFSGLLVILTLIAPWSWSWWI